MSRGPFRTARFQPPQEDTTRQNQEPQTDLWTPRPETPPRRQLDRSESHRQDRRKQTATTHNRRAQVFTLGELIQNKQTRAGSTVSRAAPEDPQAARGPGRRTRDARDFAASLLRGARLFAAGFWRGSRISPRGGDERDGRAFQRDSSGESSKYAVT